MAVIGVVRLQATTACLVSRFQDIEKFKENPAVLSIRKFARPAGPKDLERFALEPQDLADLSNCRIGACNVKLSARMLERLAHGIDWARSDSNTTAQSIFRDELLNYLETYLRDGDSALIEYRDKNKPVRLAEEFREVLDANPGLAAFVPEFREYLKQYPRERLRGVSEFFYWSTEGFGPKPVAGITHVSVYDQPGRAVIASKQLYASHYFDASLGITAAVDDRSDPSHPAMVLVYLNRSRIDLLSGFLGSLRRAILRGRLRDEMRKSLGEVARKLESTCPEYPQP